ncbi:hypothetical protein ASD64_19405 [Mesorhizobium sp. Root157]|uniref:hypothetical protein n=1 Tax=Mesorhizobium sp. Root157 TaxID=1736477 RepID=UPI0007003019|nr:hypothetical protein [Mesorhizobium sp. Root157]KQZ92268.1 hypothetical protein ASD64_19405 [Mesorhizobium sp. Root157]
MTGGRTLIAMPTKKVIGETMATLKDRCPASTHVQEIVSDDNDEQSETVIGRLVQCLKKPPTNGGEIAFITHEALKMLRYSAKLDWHLIIDEAPQVHYAFDLMIDGEVLKLAKACKKSPTPWDDLTEFSLPKHPEKVINFPEDVTERTDIHKLAWNAHAGHVSVYVPKTSIDALNSDAHFGKKLIAFSLVRPEVVKPFQSTLMLSANFQNTLIYQLWSMLGVRFVENKKLASGLRFQDHDGSRATISYVMDRSWSGKLQGKKLGISDEAVHDLIVQKVSAHFGDEPFLWVANKTHGENLFPNNSTGIHLPNISHGLNCYQHVNNVVFLSALNPSPSELSYFETLGLSDKQVKTARFYESAYQSIMRCSLRSPTDTHPVEIVVVDKATADHLHGLLPGSSIKKLDWLSTDQMELKKSGREKRYTNAAEKQAAYRLRKKEVKIHDKFISSSNKIMNLDLNKSDSRYESYININDNIQKVTSLFYGTQFQYLTAKDQEGIIIGQSNQEFIEFLKQQSERVIPNREDNSLISPAYFNPKEDVDTQRGIANIEFLRGIWLDNDGGDLRPEKLAKLFPDLEMVIFNTFSSTKAKPRYRAYIPTTTIFSIQTHNTIMDEIWSRLESVSVDHGFDRSKKNAASLFYLPCQAADLSGNIFLEFKSGKRKPLEPRDWIQKYHRKPPQAEPSIPANWLMDVAIESIRDEWRQVAMIPSAGNDNFFDFALKLRSAGVGDANLGLILRQEAAYARHPEERRRQVPSIIQSLKNYGKVSIDPTAA